MLLDVSRALRERGKEFPFEHAETIPPQDILGEEVAFDDPALMKGFFSMTEDTLRVRGEIVTEAHARCANCLKPARYAVKVPFDEYFTHTSPYARASETSEDDDEQMCFDGSKVEMSHLALTLAVLDLPMRFLCREDCPGLEEMRAYQPLTNACQEELAQEHPFAALQKLLTKDQEV